MLCYAMQIYSKSDHSHNAYNANLNVNSIHHDSLLPLVAHLSLDLLSGLITNHNAHEVKAGIHAARHTATGNDPQATQPQTCTPRITLASRIALLPSIAALPLHRRPHIRLSTHIRRNLDLGLRTIQIKAQIIDDVALLDDVGAVGQVPGGSRLADGLHLGEVVRMSGGTQAGQDALIAQEERRRADGQKRAFLLRVLLLQVREGLDDAQGFGLGLQNRIRAAAGNDEDVEFREPAVRFFEVDVCAEGGALFGGGVFGEGAKGCAEGFGCCLAGKEGLVDFIN